MGDHQHFQGKEENLNCSAEIGTVIKFVRAHGHEKKSDNAEQDVKKLFLYSAF